MSYLGRSPTGSILTGADIADGSISTAKIADTAVSTAKIADDAVGNTKLNLASDYAFTGTVSGASDLVRIANTNGAGASSISFTSIGSFTNYMMYWRDCTTSADTSLFLRFIVGGSEQTSGYRWRVKSLKDDGNDEGTQSQSANEINCGYAFDNASSSKNQGSLWFSQLSGTVTEPSVYFDNSGKMNNGVFARSIGFGTSVSSSGAISGFKFLLGSGTFTTGQITLFGIKTT